MLRLTAFQYSFFLHAIFFMIFLMIMYFPKSITEKIEVPIYVVDQSMNQKTTLSVKSINETPQNIQSKSKAIFGSSRLSQLSQVENVEAKVGNTLTKSVDTEQLADNDVSTFPVPVEEFLVSQMPVVQNIVRPEYPEQARQNKQEGYVILNILIDDTGMVRDAIIIEGPEVFRQPAMLAIKKFTFKPAMIENKNVAVRIRYTLRFKLE